MKKIILPLIASLFFTSLFSQNITDAVRYAKDGLDGTARFKALSGAFGALGADLTAIAINPAGGAVYNSSEFATTLNTTINKNESNFNNSYSNDSNTNFNLNQIGTAFVFNTGSSKWKKFTFGVAYNTVDDYDTEWNAKGTNTNSIAAYFLKYANGLRLDEISAYPEETYTEAYDAIGYNYGYSNQQAFLGYESFIIEPEDISNNANTVYTSNIAPGSFMQEYYHSTTGYNGKFTLNLATQYKDVLFLGLNINTHFIDFERAKIFREDNSNEESLINRVHFNNYLSTVGSGISLQFGGIYKLDGFRLGIAYDTPTWFTLQDETSQDIFTKSNVGIPTDEDPIYSISINPRVINIYERYKLHTPGKFTGSLAYVFGKSGLISFDYSFKDYGNTKFKPTSDSYFYNQNKEIKNQLTAASTFRFGGEYKIKDFSLRSGYRYEQSPYKNSKTIGDLNGYSFGIGYDFRGFKLDFTFDHSRRKSNNSFYQVGLTDAAKVTNKNSNFTLTALFNL